MPLTQEVGDALLFYIKNGRPPFKNSRIFISILAPLRPINRGIVGSIARRALRRAGIVTPVKGSHVFRHSAATAMLRHGATLPGLSAVLRHRSATTTALYAKVDISLLSEVAQPWPMVPTC